MERISIREACSIDDIKEANHNKNPNHNNLSVSIESKKKIHNLIIPPQSVHLVQKNQYVESKQIIAEVHAKISPFNKKIQKYFHSNLAGEMH